MFSKYIVSTGLLLLTFGLTISACADSSSVNCNKNTVYESIQCIEKENKKLIIKLDNEKNREKNDYNEWVKKIKNNCERKINYVAGEGAGLIRNQCYRDEYLSRLSFLTTGKITKEERNVHGLAVTYLPYNSVDHLKCLLNKDKNICSKFHLVSSSDLLEYYSSISRSYGDSIILPETENGKQIIISPFEDNENEGPKLAITIINAFGVVENKFIPANKNVLIDKNYNLIYMENNKEKRVSLK
ncbi:hypothetical protein QTA56_12700 [Acinetobacter sp. VNH17]|uniref:Lipoprotein n=1 Tax=Acinetobacter thutiue TaxID=2998078 RepID=A0ABT7WQX4_9GAMM|nr:hypothetical protein [Acinetobacter thutiue]MCY6412977.1 hypothetical protein [Acinetobacter thutiue]MDN0015085.1 hypothetical protein [Acinetobacter thutiue]